MEKNVYYKNMSDQIFKLVSEREVDLEKANIGAEIIIEIMEIIHPWLHVCVFISCN